MTQEKEIERASLLLTKLDRPYYLNSSTIYKVIISFSMGLIVYSFLVLMRPLIIQQITYDIQLFALNSAIVITLVFIIFHFVIKKVFKNFFNPNRWTVGKHLSTFFTIIIVASFINWNTNKYLKKENVIKINNYFQFFSIAISIGLLPMSFYLIIDDRYGRYEKKNKKKLIKKPLITEQKNKVGNVILYSYNSKNFIKFNVNQLVYITSESNYASFFILEQEGLKEYVLRNTLKKIENALISYNTIIRCHKSYLINKNFIIEVLGNAHGFRLNLKHCNIEIPVSRKFTRENLEELIENDK